jgi:hypothetical protein
MAGARLHFNLKEGDMTVQTYVGRLPVEYEAAALKKLRRELETAGVDAHLFANFEVGGHEIDLLVVKRDALFLVELKKIGGPVHGAVNGEWKVRGSQGAHVLAGGRNENPYQQMRTQYRVLSEWLEGHKAEFLSPYSSKVTRFRTPNHRGKGGPRVQIRSLLAFYPELPGESQLNIEWPVEPVSFPDLPLILREPTKRVNLSNEEIEGMAQALHLTPWDEWRHKSLPTTRSLASIRQVWLSPRQLTAHNVYVRLQLLVVQFLIDRFTHKEEHLLQQLALDAVPPVPAEWQVEPYSQPLLALNSPSHLQPQPVRVAQRNPG